MTLSTAKSRLNYIGNGAASVFPFTFKIHSVSDLVVIQTDTEGNILTLTSGYTVSGVGNSAGGSVTLAKPLPPGYKLVLKRVLALTQPTSIRNQAAFYPEVHEDVFDRLMMAIQQVQEQMDRTLVANETMSSPMVLEPPSEGAVLGWVGGRIRNLSGASPDLAAKLLGDWGASLITVMQPFAGAMARTQLQKNAESVSITDAAGVDGTGKTDSTAGINAALASGAGTVHFPPGTYQAKNILPRSNQIWRGAGRGVTTLQLPQENSTTPTFNLVKSTGDIINLTIKDMTLNGSLAFQTTPDTTWQNLAGLHLRGGSVQNLLVENCHIKNFGDQTKQAGAAAFVGPLSGVGKVVQGIKFKGCTFENCANVPGVYVSAKPGVCIKFGDVTFEDCTFIAGQYARQNMIYCLTSGDENPTLYGQSVHVSNCRFIAPYGIDTAVEVNAISGVNIDKNYFEASGTADMTPILVRGACSNVSITNNTIINLGTECNKTAGINVVPFGVERSCTNAVITGNKITDYAFNGMTINSVDNLTVSKNIVTGSAQRISTCFDVNGCNDFSVTENQIKKANIAFTLGGGQGGLNRGKINGNQMSDVGVDGNSIIASANPAQLVTYVEVAYNTLMDKVAGTVSFYAPAFTSGTGNTIHDNTLPSSLNLVNPSYAAFVTAPRLGPLKWAQGPLTLANGTGSTIEMTITGAAIGDAVDVGADQDLQGCIVTGYVSAPNTVKVRVQNGTGVAVTLVAGKWTIVVRKMF